jgi:hypothetical protein
MANNLTYYKHGILPLLTAANSTNRELISLNLDSIRQFFNLIFSGGGGGAGAC